MKQRLPFIEEIYDMETEDLQAVLKMIEADLKLMASSKTVELPDEIDSVDKYQRKA